MTSHGSTVLPTDLDILRPSSSRMSPRQTTFLNDERVEQQRGDGEQRVEPPAGLVQRLADEVGGEALLEVLEVVVGGLELGEGHRPGVKPDVDDLGDAVHVPAAVVAREHHVVDVGPVRVLELDARLALELGQRAHHLHAAVSAAPHRQRRAPVALARERPVDVALQPVAEAAVLDVLGVPVDGLVGGQQAVLDLAGGDVPGRLGVVEQRRVATPAVGIGVLVVLGAQQPAAGAQVLDEIGVGVLDPASGVGADALVVGAVQPDRVDHGQPLLLAEAEVILAEGDRGVDQPGAVGGGDEVGGQDGVALGAVGLGGDEGEGRVIRGADRSRPRGSSRAPRRPRPAPSRRARRPGSPCGPPS